MKRLLKILAWLLGALVLLIVAAIIIIPLVVDPNDYRDEIGALVKRQTGRELTITGDLDLSVFPWLGVESGAAQLSNAPGFGPEPFAQIEHANIKVKLLPLLQSEVQVDKVELSGLRLHLARDHQGRSNWEDLIKAAEQKPKEAEATPEEHRKGPPLTSLAVGGLEVNDARVVWDDKAANRRAELGNLNMTTGVVDLRTPLAFRLETDFLVAPPQTNGRVRAAGTLHYDLDAERYSMDDLALTLDAQGGLVPGGKLQAALNASASADLKQQTAQVKSLRLDAFGLRVSATLAANGILEKPKAQGTLGAEIADSEALHRAFAEMLPKNIKPATLTGARLDSKFDADLGAEQVRLSDARLKALGLNVSAQAQGNGVLSAPVFTGRLDVSEFVPRDVANKLGIKLPVVADSSALTKASLSTEFDAGKDHAALDKLLLRLDQSTLKGRIAAQRFSPLTLRYDLTLDEIDADRYMAPPAPTPAPAAPPATSAAAAPAKLPTDLLRSLDVDGTVRIGKLKASNMRSSEVRATLRAKEGALRLHPVSAKLYGGTYSGDLGLDVRGVTPRLSMDEHLRDVQIGPLLKDFMGKDYVTGKAKLDAKLTARGTEVQQVRKSLNGTASFSFQDGAVNGMNIPQMIREAYAKFKGEPVPKEEPRKTDFSEMRGSITVKDGLVTNKDLSAKSPFLRVEGQGTAHLATEKINYLVTTTFVAKMEGQGGAEAADLRGLALPVRIEGTFSKPSFSVPIGDILKKRLGAEVEKKKKEFQQQIETERKKKEEELKKNLQKELEKGLKGLFK